MARIFTSQGALADFAVFGSPTEVSSPTFTPAKALAFDASEYAYNTLSPQPALGQGAYLRAYVRVDASPTAITNLLFFSNDSNFIAILNLNTNRTLTLFNSVPTAIGSASAALATGVWHLIELYAMVNTSPNSTNGAVHARLNGTLFASSNATNAGTVRHKYAAVGSNGNAPGTTVYVDEIAVNDSTGAAPFNSWVGPVVLLDPAAAVASPVLALKAPTQIPLASSGAAASPTLTVAAGTSVVPLGSAGASAASTLTLRAPTGVGLGTSVAAATPSLALRAATRIALAASGAVAAAAATVRTWRLFPSSSLYPANTLYPDGVPPAPAVLTLSTGGQSAATLAVRAPTRVVVGTAAASSSPTLALSAPTRVALGTAAATASPALALKAPTGVPLGPAPSTASPTLTLTAPTRVTLGSAAATASSALVMQGPTDVALGSAAASSTASAALTAATRIGLGTAASTASSSAGFTAATHIALGAVAASSSASASLRAPSLLSLSSTATTSAELSVNVPSLLTFSVAGSASASATITVPVLSIPLSLGSGTATSTASLHLARRIGIPTVIDVVAGRQVVDVIQPPRQVIDVIEPDDTVDVSERAPAYYAPHP